MPSPAEYPKRPNFFAYRFCRLMAKVCLANEVGPNVCWVLTTIAMTEDAKGYRSPVTFFNEQLMAVTGFNSDDALDRARKKAIAAGWLHYQPGRKGIAGKYWVVIPERYRSFDDAPTDENPAKYFRENAGPNGNDPAPERRQVDFPPHQSGNNPDESAETTRTQPGRNPDESADHSSLTQRQLPLPSPAEPGGKKPRKRDELFDAVAEVTSTDPDAAGSHVAKVAHALRGASPPYTAAEVREFARRLGEFCPWAARDGRAKPELGELQKHIRKLRDRGKPLLVAANVKPFDPMEGHDYEVELRKGAKK